MHEDLTCRLAARLASWFDENQRLLPWRVDYDPYRVWVSEVMLQQTQVETALPYYEKFISEFPTVKVLAASKEERVLALWAGLGYYNRARNLKAASSVVARQYDGVVPSDYDALRALPGIGPYMAGAILSIAFNKPFPIVDGNVRRVLSRVNGWMESQPKDLWEAAAQLVTCAEPRVVNQALMELGAMVCSFRAPRCLLCPIQSDCVAFKSGMQSDIPRARTRPRTIHLHWFAIVQNRGERYLMRSAKGLWEFPTFSELPHGELRRVGDCRHTITHHRLNVAVYAGTLDDATGLVWKKPLSVPISSLSRKILAASQGKI